MRAMPATPFAPSLPVRQRAKYPPGDLAIWVFIFAELLAFGVLFVSYGIVRVKHLALFNEMQLTLDRQSGAINTLLLITASWCVARGVTAIGAGRQQASARWQAAGILAGLGFIAVKCLEYADKFAAGIDLETNLFYMFYLSLTMFHFLHVVFGLVILVYVWRKTCRGGYSAGNHGGMETGASYWHMVDLVWIVLFPLLYVMR